MSRSNGESIDDVLSSADIATQAAIVDTTTEYHYNTLDDVITNILRKEQDKKVELSISILEKIEYEEKDTESLIEIIYLKLLFKKFIVDFCTNKNDTNKFKKEIIIKISEKYEK